jgi:Amt family ammonium transporter
LSALLAPVAAGYALLQGAEPAAVAAPAAVPAIVAADTAWVLVSTALVLLMTPAVGFFYGGLVRAKNALNTMMMCVGALGVVGVVWALAAYSIAFAEGGAYVGGTGFLLLKGVGLDAKGTIPHILFMAYQGTFAVVTATLIAGAVVERMRFGPYLAFITLWTLVVYAPVAHWVWGGGWLSSLGVLDFAGGTVVHINAGIAAPIAALVVGGRKDFGRQAVLPHNVPFVLLGASLLYFGWFGFNGGSALAANGVAALAFTNTLLAPMSALAVWMALDAMRVGHATAVGAATALVVGLVVITPAAGFVSPMSALAMGALGVVPSYYAIVWRARTRLDDSLDVLAGHGCGGVTGALLTGIFAEAKWGGATDGALFGNTGQLGLQAMGVAATLAYSGVATFALLKLLALVMPLRATVRSEGMGMDITQHGEEAYAEGEGAVLVFPEVQPAPRVYAAPVPRAEGA